MKLRVSLLLVMATAICVGIAGFAGAAQRDPLGNGAVLRTDAGIHVNRITGTIRIVTPDNKVITVTRGDRLPEIPSGSKIMVLSGRAEIEMGGMRAVLGERQAVVVSKDSATGSVRMAAAEGSVGTIRVRAGSSTVLLAGGNAVSVTTNKETNKQEIKAEQGTLTVITPQGKKELKEGGQMTSDPVARQNRENRGNDSPVIPEPPQPKTEEASPSVPQ